VGLGKVSGSRARGQQKGRLKQGGVNLVVVAVVGESRVRSLGIKAEAVGSGASSFVPPAAGPQCHQGCHHHAQRPQSVRIS